MGILNPVGNNGCLTAVGTDLRVISYMSQLLAAIRTNICFANEVLIAYFPFLNYILIS